MLNESTQFHCRDAYSSFGTSAHETGFVSFNSNALRHYTADGKRRRHPSTTASMRADFAAQLQTLYPGIRRIKVIDSGILFSARVRIHSGRIVFCKAYSLQNLYGLVCEGIASVLAAA